MASPREQFANALIGLTSKIMLRVLHDDQEGTNKWIRGVLTGRQQPQKPPKPLRRDDAFLMRLLKWYSEIDASLRTLETIEKMARRAPAKDSGVEPTAQLRVLVEAYLSEIYVLAERCDAFLTTIDRDCRKDSRWTDVRRQIVALRATNKATLGPILSVRGAHIHEERHDDFDMQRLSTLRILAPNDEAFSTIHRRALREGRQKKVRWMAQNNAEIRKLLDHYFAGIYSVVFDGAGTPRYPTAPRQKPTQ